MNTNYAVYLGKEQQNGFTGFHSEKNFFCVVEIFDGFTLEQGEDLMSALAQAGVAAFDSLIGFDAAISGILRRHNIPLDTSVAAGYLKDDVLYLKTVGAGEVYIHRGHKTERIIFGNTMASGRSKKNDIYIFTTTFFTQSLKGVQRLKDCFTSHHSLSEYPDYIKSEIGHEDDTGAVALIMQTANDDTIKQHSPATPQPNRTPFTALQVGSKLSSFPHKKRIVGGALVLCVAFLLWNVLGGIVMQKGRVVGQDLEKVESLIYKMEESKDDIARSLDLGNQARSELERMKKSEATGILLTRIRSIEDEVLSREKKEASLFYDLSIEDKSAKGTRMNVSGDTAYILDESGIVYLLSLEKKSLDKRTSDKKINKNAVIAGYEKKAYVLDPMVGIIEYLDGGKTDIVIERDDTWKDIGGMHVYYGNIYILERQDGDIYKYLVFSEGFGGKSSYFKGSYDVIENSSTFAIDSSVYVSGSSGITKYTSGLKDSTEFPFPEKNITLTKVVAHPDEEDIVVWNKESGAVYLFTKEGAYQKQIINEQLKKANDIELFKKQLFLLQGNSIYKIGL